MRQILHIFAKDVRRFWPEILISLVITAGFVLVYPIQWGAGIPGWMTAGQAREYNRQLGVLVYTLMVLMPLSWWLLIARVVHAERLVGEDQFWLTRPYAWQKLLAEKVLFVGVFVALPFLTAECLLLKEAGLPMFGNVVGLLFNLGMVCAVLPLPLMTLAALTRNFARMTLTLLGALVCVAGMAAVAIYEDSHAVSVSVPYGDRISIPLVFVLCGIAVVLQFARRLVWLAWVLLMTVPLSVGTELTFLPNSAMVSAAYPAGTGLNAPVSFALMDDEAHSVGVQQGANEDQVMLHLPLEVSGVERGMAVVAEDAMVAVEAQDGTHWTSPWQAVHTETFREGDWVTSLDLKLSRAIWERFRRKIVRVRLTVAVTEAKSGKPEVISLPVGDFVAPGIGVCSSGIFSSQSREFDTKGGWPTCRTALHAPQLTYVTARWSNRPCSEGLPGTEDGALGDAWVGALDNGAEGGSGGEPADFGLTSVWTTTISLSNSTRIDIDASGKQTYRGRDLCPGTPMSFTQYTVVRRTRVEARLPEFVMPGEMHGLEMY